MDDMEDGTRYLPNPYAANRGYESLHRSKLPVRDATYPHNVVNQYVEGDGDIEVSEDGEEEEDDNEEDSIKLNGKIEDVNDVDVVVDEDGDENGDGGSDDEDDGDDNPNDYSRRIVSVDQNRHQKKRKMKSLLSSYEFAPRATAPLATTSSASKPSYGGRNALSDWSEHETYVLLDAWGNRFLQRGRKSLRSEEWQEVAEKVSQESKLDRSDTQCRNRLDTLKKKYKKEKMKLNGTGGSTCKWVYFKKMDMLLSSSPQQNGLSRRHTSVNSKDYVVRNPRGVSFNRASGLDGTSNSPANSLSIEAEENSLDMLQPERTNKGNGASFRLLADSITKFSDIYEKIESRKRKQMLELEKMRMDFHRELETQKRQILDQARAEIAKIRRGDDK